MWELEPVSQTNCFDERIYKSSLQPFAGTWFTCKGVCANFKSGNVFNAAGIGYWRSLILHWNISRREEKSISVMDANLYAHQYSKYVFLWNDVLFALWIVQIVEWKLATVQYYRNWPWWSVKWENVKWSDANDWPRKGPVNSAVIGLGATFSGVRINEILTVTMNRQHVVAFRQYFFLKPFVGGNSLCLPFMFRVAARCFFDANLSGIIFQRKCFV